MLIETDSIQHLQDTAAEIYKVEIIVLKASIASLSSNISQKKRGDIVNEILETFGTCLMVSYQST